MGRRNENGMRVQCNHCGYSWFYQGDKPISSCPHCGYRIRIRPSSYGEVARPAGDISSKTAEQVRYY